MQFGVLARRRQIRTRFVCDLIAESRCGAEQAVFLCQPPRLDRGEASAITASIQR